MNYPELLLKSPIHGARRVARLGWSFVLLVAAAVAAEPKPTVPAGGGEGVTVEPAAARAGMPGETPAERDARMQWWREAKFGLFIHWGVYAVPAGRHGTRTDYGEWIMHSAKIPAEEYRGFARQFNPTKYDPKQWAAIAKDAGMRYVVITSKHHDGFALFPSAVTDWDVADATPYGKDLLAPLVSEAQRQGLKIGFYYSQAQDWMHPGGAKSGFQEGQGWDEAHRGSFDTYLKTIAEPQVKELLTRYPIDILWWDTPTWMNERRIAPFVELTRLRPGMVTNNRLGAGAGGDTATPEQFVPVTGIPGDWETCMTMNGHWGYNAADNRWKSSVELIRQLAEICAKGGNFLLNVGPTAEGEFPAACVERLQDMGRWLRVNGESIYGTQAGPFAHLSWGVATRKSDRLYLHVFDWPADGRLRVPLGNRATSAWLLSEPATKLPVAREEGRLVITIPTRAPDAASSVVVLQIEGEPSVPALPTVGATVTASQAAPGSGPEKVLDGTADGRWRAPAGTTSASLQLELARPELISAIGIDEPDVWPRLRQEYVIEAQTGNGWTVLAQGSTSGHGLKRPIGPVTAKTLRIRLESSVGEPGLAEVQLYRPE